MISRLLSHPGRVKDSHPLNNTETKDKCHLAHKGFSFLASFISAAILTVALFWKFSNPGGELFN